MITPSPIRRCLRHLPALLGYILVACLATFPGVTRLGTHLIGAGDNFYFAWEIWWFHHALFELHTNPLVNTTLFFPTPHVAQICSTPVNVLPGMLVYGLFGPVVTYNLLVLAGLVLSGLGAYLLSLRWAGRRDAAFIGGLAYAFSAAHMSHVANGHLNVMSIQWVPFAAIALFALYEQPSWRRAAAFAIALVLVAATDLYVAIYGLGSLLGAFVLYHLITERDRLLDRDFLIRALSALGIAGLVVAPYYATLMTTLQGAGSTVTLRASVHRFGQDLVQLFLPAPWNPWLGTWCARWLPRVTNTDDWGYLGWGPLVLAAIALFRSQAPRRGFWAAFTLLAALLSLGTHLHVAGATGLPLPYAIAPHLPLLQNLRAPGRFMAFAMLGLAVLSACGAARLIEARPRTGCLVLALLVGWTALESVTFFPFPSASAAVPAFYQRLAAEPAGGVLELPNGDPSWGGPTQHWMFYQITHGHPLVYGHGPRPTDEALAFSQKTPVVHELVDLIHTDFALSLAPAARAGARDRLAHDGIAYVVLHHESIIPQERYVRLAADLDGMFGPSVYRDEQMVVYRLK